jgi:hypothetical protein
MECKRLAKLGRWRIRLLQEANRSSSVNRKPQPEVEGETRVRVAFSSKMWFGMAAQLNGQRHNL